MSIATPMRRSKALSLPNILTYGRLVAVPAVVPGVVPVAALVVAPVAVRAALAPVAALYLLRPAMSVAAPTVVWAVDPF